MAREEASRTAPAKAPASANPAGNRRKATNLQKAKKKNASNPSARSAHPTYLEMIGEAVTSLKERTGSSQYAITKFIEEKHKSHLPSNFSKLLLVQLRKFVASGKLTKVKNSYKLPAKTKKPSVTEPTKTNKTVTATLKPKSAVAAKPKVKSTTVAKPKAAVKVSKAKPKTVAVKSNNRPAKVAKTSAKQTPGKKVAVPKKTVAAPKKVAKTTKKVKSGSSAVKVPVKKALARKA